MAQEGTKKSAGYSGEDEEPVALDVTLEGETRAATVSRMGSLTEVHFKNNTVSVTVTCRSAAS